MNRLIIVALGAFVVGVVGGFLLAGALPGDVSFSKDAEGCWLVTVDERSEKPYVYQEKGSEEWKVIRPGETARICTDFDLYESIPTPEDP